MDRNPKESAIQPRINPAVEQRNAANLKRTLGQALLSFEKNKEWADYGHWLQKVAKYLDDYPSYQIPEKLTFAKRLAQCLNPNLPPAIHNNTIQVYSLIFRNMRDCGYNWCEDLGLYSIGIFPLFQYASFQVKPKILQLYREHYFPLGKQLIPCITGLVVSILPGVDEQNEGLQKDVYSTLDQLSDCVTKKYFIGAIWMAILRNPKVRLAGVKYLMKRLKKLYADPEENDEGAAYSDSGMDDDLGDQTPVKAQKPHRGVDHPSFRKESDQLAGKEDQNTTDVANSTMREEAKESQAGDENIRYFGHQPTAEDEEFLKSIDVDLQEDSEINIEYPNKCSLVLNALIACLEDENVLVQKMCLDFMYSHFKLASDIFSENEKCILVEAALSLLIRKDQQILRRVYTWIFGPPDMENKYQVTEKNAKVLDYLIIAFISIFNRVPTDSFEATVPLKVLQNFYMEHDHLVEQTLPQLAIPFLSYIFKYSQPGKDFSDEVHKSGARFMENITSYFSILLTSLSGSLEAQIIDQNNEKCLEVINLIEFTFKLEASISNKEENINYIEQRDYLKSIISGILRSVSSISPDQKNLIPFIETALNLNLNLIDKLERVEQNLLKLISDSNLSEEEVAKFTQPRSSDYGFVETLELFSRFYERIVEQILSFQSESQISQKFLNLFASASETIVKVQIFHLEHSLTSLPSWLHSVIQCIRSSFPAVSIIGIKTIQSLLISKSKKPIYETIRNLITLEGSKNKTNDIVRRTTEKLWGLLDVHYIQNTVSDLLVTFQAHFPKIFADTVSNSFHVPSITEKEAAIRRFASFWKLSSDMVKSEFIESGTGLFIMLDFLDNDNPLLRHSSKSWLIDSIPFLYRIIDPIFEILMQCNYNGMVGDDHHLKLYVTETKQHFFTEVYDTDIVQDSFRKLKSIMITSNELFTRYIISIRCSERLRRHKPFFVSNNVYNPDTCTYLDLLVLLCLKYIQGQAIESLSPKFQIQNASVNASASEFMELLITHVETKELSAKMTHFIMEPLLIILHHAINNFDYVLQVQLLSLLKVILCQSSFCSYEGTRYKCVALLSSNKFVPNLLKGLNVDQPYVRVQFINFISLCISVLTEHLPQKETLTNSVISILRAYFDIILNKHLEISENNDEFESWESDNVNFEEDPASRKIVEMSGDEAKKAEETKTRAARNTFTIRYQSQNEIYILLEGVKKILDYFLKFKTLADTPEVKGYEDESSGVFTTMKDIFTFGLLSKSPQEERREVSPGTQTSDTAKAILNDLFKIVYIFIYCWRLSKEFRQCADFTAMGITPYSFEKYNDVNKMIKDYHMKIDLHTKNVKSLIISVLKPLMYQYTNDTISSFINYWILECQKKLDMSINPRMMKEIEILVSMNVPVEMFISALTRNQIVNDISNYYTRKLQQNKKATVPLNYETAKTESQILFLLYTYISFSYIDINFLKKEYLIRLWTTALNFTKLMGVSKAVSTQLWLLEIIYLLSLKYNPKEILGDTRIKKEMHDQINVLLMSLANVCAKTTIVYFNDPQASQQTAKFKTILPFPPNVYENFKKHLESSDKPFTMAAEDMSPRRHEIEVLMENAVKIEKLMFHNLEGETSETGLYDRYRLFSFKTLKAVGLTVIQNTYSPERLDRIIIRMKDFMEIIFPLMENKAPENQPFLECASELLYTQLESSRSFLVKEYKKNILDIFNGNDFFKCTKQTLKYWSKIIDWVVTMDKSDLFSEFLTKVSAFSFLYSRDSETKQKIKSFERICFIIYSGERDKYQGKLYILLEKMGEVIKNADSANPSLLILVLFCVRILILRLSPSSLNELFRHIWPILLTLLMQIFNKKNTQKNPNLTLAALKLIEMMSIVQLEEFYINQWVFLFDYFGLTIEPAGPGENNSVAQTSDGTEIIGGEAKSKISNFIYQPYITSVVQDNLKINYKSRQLEVQKGFKKMQRKIVMTMTNVDDEIEIKAKALFLIQYLIQQNEFRTEVDPHQIESLLEGDFISLDDYIFNIN